MSEVQEAASWYIGEPEPEAIDIPGLGYVDFQIYPHVTDESVREIRQNLKDEHTYYLMRDGSAIVIDGDSVKVCGEVEIVGSGR